MGKIVWLQNTSLPVVAPASTNEDTYDGSSAIVEAESVNGISDDNTGFLKLLLQYKANPNEVKMG